MGLDFSCLLAQNEKEPSRSDEVNQKASSARSVAAEDPYKIGYADGFADGEKEGHRPGYSAGYKEGMEMGYQAGMAREDDDMVNVTPYEDPTPTKKSYAAEDLQDSYEVGYWLGFAAGEAWGYGKGFDLGYELGYREGYGVGSQAASSAGFHHSDIYRKKLMFGTITKTEGYCNFNLY